jgi:hypothetical protein
MGVTTRKRERDSLNSMCNSYKEQVRQGGIYRIMYRGCQERNSMMEGGSLMTEEG